MMWEEVILNKKTAKTIGKVVVFCVTVVVLVAAGFIAYQFAKRAMSTGGGGSVGLGGVPGAGDVFIGAYLDANAEKLKQPAGTDDTPVTFVISPGETVAEIATRLKEAGLVVDAVLFRRYVQYHGLDTGIEAGEFTLRQTMTIPEVADVLQKGQVAEQVVTIQEGLRLEQVVAAVAEQTTIPEDEFRTLVTTGWRTAGFPYDFLAEVPPGATLEGFLFPETYRLPENATAMDLLSRMLDTFDARVTPEMRVAAADHEMSFYELIAMASIVEREAMLDEERPFIAGVYHNRLRDGWLLGACPTVQYAIGTPENWWPQLTLEMTEVESPYNTYRNLGLPPTPICSPGLASIQATAYPADTDYFYFLADCTKNDGSHLFAVTEEEHLRNYALCGGAVP
jgi:UPF0755 protein